MKKIVTKNRQLLLFCSVVMMFLAGVGIIQSVMEDTPTLKEVPVVSQGVKEEKKEVVIETVQAPVKGEEEIVRYYYDINGDKSKLENALVYFEGVYRPNLGIDYSNSGKSFDVVSSASGTVSKVSDDPLLGWLVTIEHDYGVETTYQSLDEVLVEKDQKIAQGEIVGKSGENLYEADLGNHLHFIVEVDDVIINPEQAIGKQLDSLS